MKEYTFYSKTFTELKRKTKKNKKIYLNLNTYRNLKHFENNDSKKQYKKDMLEQIENCPVFDKPVEITFKLIKNSRRKTDKHNFYSVIAKYLFDALTESGKWIDDNDDFIKQEILLPTEYEKQEHNLVIITIKEKGE